MRKLIFALPLLAVACTPPQQKSSIAALESGLTAADILALQYEKQPRCPATPICSAQPVVDDIKKAAKSAYDAVKGAEVSAANGQAVDMTAATAALAAYQAIVVTNTKVH